jgi:hypothetical protein
MALNGPPGDYALGPSGPRRRPLASRHYGGWLGLFVKHLVGASKIKGLETPFKQAQPPAKMAHNQYRIMRHNPRVELCPKSARKMKKKWRIGEKMGFQVFCGKSGENEEMGGRRWVVMVERGRGW